jgi:hypothetical protein
VNLNARNQHAMNWTSVRYFEKSVSLVFGQVPGERNSYFELVHHAHCWTRSTRVVGKGSRVREGYLHSPERPCVALRIHLDGDTHAGTQAGRDQFLRAGPNVLAADVGWFIGRKHVRTDAYFLRVFLNSGNNGYGSGHIFSPRVGVHARHANLGSSGVGQLLAGQAQSPWQYAWRDGDGVDPWQVLQRKIAKNMPGGISRKR